MAQMNASWGTAGGGRRARRANRVEAMQSLHRQGSKTKLMASLGLHRCNTAPPSLPSKQENLKKSSSASCIALMKKQQEEQSSSPTLPRRRSSLRQLMTKIPSLTNIVQDAVPQQEVVQLPERSLLCGRGSEGSLIRQASERSLVKKISLSLQQSELSGDSDDGSLMSTSMMSSSLMAEQSTQFQDSMDSIDFDFNEENENNDWRQKVQIDAPGKVKPVPPLHRKELVIGGLLGQGAFSKVLAVEGITLMSQPELSKKKRQLPQEQLPQQSPTLEMENVLARQELAQDKNKLAVKHLNRKLLRKPKQFLQAARDLAREAQVLACLNCDYIVKLRAVSLGGTTALDSGHFNDFFLVLDRLEDTLDDRIVRWKEQQQTSTRPQDFLYRTTLYALELASALEYLHERRIVFRDTKPQNVGFLSLSPAVEGDDNKQDRCQLFDFGLCRSLPQIDRPVTPPADGSGAEEKQEDASLHHDETFLMSIAGTQRYMAPECQLGEGYNQKADVYSFAVTYYEMLSLRKPYGDILRSHKFREYICEMKQRPYLGDLALPEPMEQLLKESWCESIPNRLSMRQVKDRLGEILLQLEQTA